MSRDNIALSVNNQDPDLHFLQREAVRNLEANFLGLHCGLERVKLRRQQKLDWKTADRQQAARRTIDTLAYSKEQG